MTGQYSRNRTPIVGVAIVTFLLPTLFCKLGGAAALGCNLFSKTVWVVLALTRSVILLAIWQAVSAYLWEDSGLFHQLLQIMASIWPLLYSMAS